MKCKNFALQSCFFGRMSILWRRVVPFVLRPDLSAPSAGDDERPPDANVPAIALPIATSIAPRLENFGESYPAHRWLSVLKRSVATRTPRRQANGAGRAVTLHQRSRELDRYFSTGSRTRLFCAGRAQGQSTSGLNGLNKPVGFSRFTQTCRLQCATGMGVPSTSNARPSNAGTGWPTSMTMYSTPTNFG